MKLSRIAVEKHNDPALYVRRKGVNTAVTAADNLEALQEAEKAAGIEPDPHVAAFMKANTLEGKAESIHTEFVLHILGLNVCADTLVSLRDFPSTC